LKTQARTIAEGLKAAVGKEHAVGQQKENRLLHHSRIVVAPRADILWLEEPGIAGYSSVVEVAGIVRSQFVGT